ncbi:MAG: ribonuclease III [Acidobacteria bacterium]|nr:ribonuclease III [Acidobacteriota bacterium]
MWDLVEYRARIAELYAILGHRFLEPALLCRALTHRSFANENLHLGLEHNEALEFIGDSVLGFVVSTRLFERFPGRTEGEYSRMRSYLVSGEHLGELAQTLHLGHFVLLGRGEVKTGGALKKNILSDTLEAVIAAVYLDGGIRPARAFVHRLFRKAFQALEKGGCPSEDYKSRLQISLAEDHRPAPRYVLVGEDGPPHDRCFRVEVWIGERRAGTGTGRSKKEAQQKAAKQAIEAKEAPSRSD